MNSMHVDNRVIVALDFDFDFDSATAARRLVERLGERK